MPASIDLIALFLLSYPLLCVQVSECVQDEAETQNEMIEYKIRPILAPQNLFLSLVITKSTSSSSLQIVGDQDNIRFEWESWINSARDLLKACNLLQKNNRADTFVGPFELVKKVDLARPMRTLSHSDQDQVLSNLPGQLHVWTVWTMFEVRFCKFELDQWMHACGTLPVVRSKMEV